MGGFLDPGAQSTAWKDVLRLDTDDNYARAKLLQVVGQKGKGKGMGIKASLLEGFDRQASDGTRGQAHVGGIDHHDQAGTVAPHNPGKILRGHSGIDCIPGTIFKEAGHIRADSVITFFCVSYSQQDPGVGMGGTCSGFHISFSIDWGGTGVNLGWAARLPEARCGPKGILFCCGEVWAINPDLVRRLRRDAGDFVEEL